MDMLRLLVLALALLGLAPANAQWAQLADDPPLIPYRQGQWWGFARPGGQLAVAPQYQSVGRLHDNRAWVQLNGKFGFISSLGHVVVPIRYDSVRNYNYGLATVYRDGQMYQLNLQGQEQPPVFRGICGGSKVVMMYFQIFRLPDGRTGFYQITGASAPDPVTGKRTVYADSTFLPYDEVRENYAGLALVAKDGRWGAINADLELVAPLVYDTILPLDATSDALPGYCPVRRDGKWGFIAPDGRELVAPQYQNVTFFYDGLALVKPPGGPWGYLDRRGIAYFTD